jgi:hypothetical protein
MKWTMPPGSVGHKAKCVIYLTDAELERLTGYKRPADQARWLERNGVPFTKNARGRPVVRHDMDKTATTAFELGPVP